jgi:hypothetical protein
MRFFADVETLFSVSPVKSDALAKIQFFADVETLFSVSRELASSFPHKNLQEITGLPGRRSALECSFNFCKAPRESILGDDRAFLF